jgi:hypothetical protein
MKRSLPEANGEIALEELKRLRTELVIVSDYLLKPVEEEELKTGDSACQAAKAPETSLYSPFITRVMRYLQENYQDEELDLTRGQRDLNSAPIISATF